MGSTDKPHALPGRWPGCRQALPSNGPAQAGVKAAPNSAWGEGTKSSDCSGSEPKVSGSPGTEPPPSLLPAPPLAARLCGVCVPSTLALPTPRKDQEHRKPLRPKRVEASRARARTGFERTLNLATIQGRILGRKECIPYPGTSEGKELAGNKRPGPPGKRAFPLERAEAQSSGGQGC